MNEQEKEIYTEPTKHVCKFCKQESVILTIGEETIYHPRTEEMEKEAKRLLEYHKSGWGVSYTQPRTTYTYKICVNCSKIETITYHTKGRVSTHSLRESAYPW